MNRMRAAVLRYAPYWLQDWAITMYSTRSYRRRRGGVYAKWRKYYKSMEGVEATVIQEEAARRLDDFLRFASARSAWYRAYKEKSLDSFPPLEKTQLLANLDQIATVGPRNGLASLTGGTTGASMKVYYAMSDLQERAALLDHFRESHGYKLGKRVAWFSGKPIASGSDVRKGRCYRDDLINKIRFFSTFHINRRNFDAYWQALEGFRPEFIVGFPSSIYDIAVIAHERGLTATFPVRAVFPTAETLLPIHRDIIGAVFKTKLYDQYASSEGAPFILECSHGRLHVHPLSGKFEVIDSDGSPALEGEALVTSFTTHGTPLIRYRIGDRIKLSEPSKRCGCGSDFPLVERIEGRNTDYIWSVENGRINSVNFSNAAKEVRGIRCFQVWQSDPDRIEIRIVASREFDAAQEREFLKAVRLRTGNSMNIDLHRVNELPREKSGKFRVIKNSLTGLG